MNGPVRWGILGCARVARRRVMPAVQQVEGATLTAVASRELSKAQQFAEQFDVPAAYGSYEVLLHDPDVEVIYIPLPNHLHAEWSIQALRAGKHVLCEKPLTMDAAEARQIQAVRDEMGLYCLEAFAYRFNPVVDKAFEIARSGALGELRYIHTAMSFVMGKPDPNNVRIKPEMGGGALYDVGCYAINAQRMMAGREPLTAWATMQWSEQYGVDIAGTATLDFGDELWGTVHWSYDAAYGAPLVAVGTKARLTAPHGWRPPPGEPALWLDVGDETTAIHVERIDDYVGEVQDLSLAIRGEQAPRYAWEPLDATMRVLDACYASDKSGRAERV
jgi:xylose dehydrogenase (NAD/NADP)